MSASMTEGTARPTRDPCSECSGSTECVKYAYRWTCDGESGVDTYTLCRDCDERDESPA